MSRLPLPIVFALTGLVSTVPALASAQSQSSSRIKLAQGAVQPQESRDQATARQVMRTYAGCVARARRQWADGTLALPYLSAEQGAYVRSGAGGSDECKGRTGLRLRFRPGNMIGGMCIARRDPAAVRGLLVTTPASEKERAAAVRVIPNVSNCVDQGQSLTLDLPALRALLAPALYRLLGRLAAAERG